MAIHRLTAPSQHKIALQVGISRAMANGYIKQLAAEKLLKVSNRNNRDLDYQLTARGKEELTRLLMDYSAEIIQLYTQAKNEIGKRLAAVLPLEAPSRVVLFGASETCEMALQVMGNFPKAKVIGIVDSDNSKQNSFFHGHRVLAPDRISSLAPDFLVITSFARQNEIYESVRHFAENGVKIAKLAVI